MRTQIEDENGRTHEGWERLVGRRDERVVAEDHAIEPGEVLEVHPPVLEQPKIDLDEPGRLPHACSRLELDKCTRRCKKEANR